MTCNFRIGQKVVCVESCDLGQGFSSDWNGDAPCEGATYTIRDMKPSRTVLNGVAVIILYFEEIRRKRDPFFGHELGYWHVRFRALQESEDALSALRAILLDPSRKVSGEEGPVRKPARERA